jgi:hypothetical protein
MNLFIHPESVRSVHDSKLDTAVSQQPRLMRLVRKHTHA